MSFTQFPVSGIIKVANAGVLPSIADQGDIACDLSTGNLYVFFDAAWAMFAGPSGGGANTALSNLTAPTTVNVDLLPGTASTLNLGNSSFPWATASINQLEAAGVVVIDIGAQALIDGAGVNSILWASRLMYDAAGVPCADYNARFLLDSSGTPSANYDSRNLLDSAGNTQLNWTSPSSIVVHNDIVPAADNTQRLGSNINRWLVVRTSQVQSLNGDPRISVAAGTLDDTSSTAAINWGTRQLLNVSAASELSWGTGGVSINNMLTLAQLSADPTGAAGMIYYNTTSNTIRWYNGTAWASLL